MNKIYKVMMICALSVIGAGVLADYYSPTLAQWQSLEAVAADYSEKLHQKIIKKRKIKEVMEKSPVKTSIKAKIIFGLNSWARLPNDSQNTFDGWGRDPKLSELDANALFIKIIQSGDTVALGSFLEMVQGTSFNVNDNFSYVTAPEGHREYRCSEYLNYTPLFLATASNKLGVIDMLVRHGAKISASTVSVAMAQRNQVLAEVLISKADRLRQGNLSVGVPLISHSPVEGVLVLPPVIDPVIDMVEGAVVSTGLTSLAQGRERNQTGLLTNRNIAPTRNTSGWYVIFLMLLFLPSLCLSFAGKWEIKNRVTDYLA